MIQILPNFNFRMCKFGARKNNVYQLVCLFLTKILKYKQMLLIKVGLAGVQVCTSPVPFLGYNFEDLRDGHWPKIRTYHTYIVVVTGVLFR